MRKAWIHRLEKYGTSGAKDPEARSRAVSKSHKSRSKEEIQASVEKGMQTRREKYGPTMRRKKVTE